MGEKMKQALSGFGVAVFLFCGTMWGQQWRDWTGASNNYTILYRFRVLNGGQSCDMEFRDENQGESYTTFDAAVDYKATTVAPDEARMKTTNVHVVTSTNHNAVAQVPNCAGVTEIHVSFVQRR